MSKEQTNNVIYISHLLPDEEMQELLKNSELGVESIEFSISENLLSRYSRTNHADGTCEDGKPATDTAWPVSGPHPGNI